MPFRSIPGLSKQEELIIQAFKNNTFNETYELLIRNIWFHHIFDSANDYKPYEILESIGTN